MTLTKLNVRWSENDSAILVELARKASSFKTLEELAQAYNESAEVERTIGAVRMYLEKFRSLPAALTPFTREQIETVTRLSNQYGWRQLKVRSTKTKAKQAPPLVKRVPEEPPTTTDGLVTARQAAIKFGCSVSAIYLYVKRAGIAHVAAPLVLQTPTGPRRITGWFYPLDALEKYFGQRIHEGHRGRPVSRLAATPTEPALSSEKDRALALLKEGKISTTEALLLLERIQ